MDAHVLEESCLWLLESAPYAMLIADAAGRIVYTNSLAEELFGYSREELRSLTAECLLPQRYRHEYSFQPRQHTIGSGLKLLGQRKDGSEVAVDIDLSSLETASGTMTMVAIRDMTGRESSIEELRHTETRLEHIIDSISDIVWSISPSGDRVFFVNSAWERAFGHSHIEAQNNPGLWRQTIHPEDRALAADALTMLLAKDQFDLEYRIVRPDGKVRWISNHATVVRDKRGVPVRIDSIGRDITRRKRAEERQATLVHELKSANEELKNFAYVVSHDLKAPLRAIGSLTEWIATDYADKFDDEGREHLRLLVGRARRMDALIDGILQYSRVGQAHEGRTDVDLDALLHEVIDSLAPPTHFRIEIDTPPANRAYRAHPYAAGVSESAFKCH